MTDFVVTGTTTVQQTLANGEYGYIATDGELVVAGADAIVGSGSIQMAVLGNLTSFGDFNAFDFDGVDMDMVVGASGSVFAISDNALDLVASSRIELTNLGAINADGIAISAMTSDTGTAMNIFNAGTLNGSTAISASSGTGTLIISNTGSMFTNGTTISVSSSTGPTVLNNSGTIESFGSFAVFFSAGNDRLFNTGTIIGNVLLGVGNDLYDGTGGFIAGRVDGSTGNDTIIGGEFAETFRGGNDEDTIVAGGGNDTIEGTDFDSANDIYDGGEGIDTIELNADGNDVTVDLAVGIASGGLFGVDTLISIENAVTGNGNDLLIGNDEDNYLNGGANNDTLIGGLGADYLKGGQGLDTADYSDSTSFVNVSLLTGFVGGGSGNHAMGDTFSSIENLTGSDFNDLLNGDHNDNILEGGAGSDFLNGRDGIDTADYATSNAGVNVSLLTGYAAGGHASGDTFSSIENLSGSAYDDLLSGNAMGNVLTGGNGNDLLRGRGGADDLIGGEGSDTANYSDSTGFVNVSLLTGFAAGGHAAGDTFSSIENVTGSSFNDLLNGDHDDNVLEGGAGGDFLNGRNGIDTADYATSNAGVNISLLTGFAAGGHAAGDTFSSIENLSGSNFDDLLNGDNVANVLQGRAGADFNNGRDGLDTASYEESNAGVNVNLLTGVAAGGHAAGDTFASIENLTGSMHADTLTGDNTANVINGLGGDDTLSGLNGTDTFVFTDDFGLDTIMDFVDGTELLDFSGSSQLNAIGDLTISSSGGDALVMDDFGNQITIIGQAGNIDASDFVF